MSAKRSRSPRHSGLTGIEIRTDKRGRKSYRGTAYDPRIGRHRTGKWTRNLAEARTWRFDTLARVRSGALSGSIGPTVIEAIKEFIAGIASGSITNRSGRPYKPSVVAGYRRDLMRRVVPVLGHTRLSEVSLPDIQRWADSLAADGLAPSSVRNIVNALRALYGWALPRGLASVNPTRGLRLPSGEKVRDRVATPADAAQLIAVLDPPDRAAFGVAVYTGLRLGEVLALTWNEIDFSAHTIGVERSWDAASHRFISPKSRAGVRVVPMPQRLEVLLRDHYRTTSAGLVFPGKIPERPIHPTSLRARIYKAWSAAGLQRLRFHEARHTAASLFIAAGWNAKTVATYMGHASVSITFDRYGHLFPGSEDDARDLLDRFLAR